MEGLLDITDNLVKGEVVHPEGVRVMDGPDPYLVVAADKGTAALSDTANDVSQRYGFWLGDAFASGGSHGYDHKVLGITARGVWESVKRHFRELGIDPATQPVHGRRDRRHVGRRVRQRHALHATGSGCSPRSIIGTSSSIPTPIRRRRSRSGSACSSCPDRRGPTTTGRSCPKAPT